VDYKLLNTFFACNVKGDTSCVEFPIDSLFLQSKWETHIPDIGDARCVGASPFSSDTRCVFRGRVSLFLHQKLHTLQKHNQDIKWLYFTQISNEGHILTH
jgi:hypothetical protein